MHPDQKSGYDEADLSSAFECNSERVKQLRHEYVEVCIVHFSTLTLHTFLHVNVLYTKSMLNYTILSFTVFQRVLQMDAE